MSSDQPPTYQETIGNYAPSQVVYPPPQPCCPSQGYPQNIYPPPQNTYPTPQNAYPPPQNAYPPPQGYPTPGYPSGQRVVYPNGNDYHSPYPQNKELPTAYPGSYQNQTCPGAYPSHTTTITHQVPLGQHNVVVVGGCPACRIGVLEDDFTCLGVCCAIFFFPLGLLCCLAMRQRRCPNCGAVFD